MRLIISLLFLVVLSVKHYGQASYGIVDQEAIDNSIEEEFVNRNEQIQQMTVLVDTIKLHNIEFLQRNYQKIIKYINGGCASAEEVKRMEVYILYLQQQVLDTGKALDSLIASAKKEAFEIGTIYAQDILENLSVENELRIIYDAAVVLYASDIIEDFTLYILEVIKRQKNELQEKIDLSQYEIAISNKQKILPTYRQYLDRK